MIPIQPIRPAGTFPFEKEIANIEQGMSNDEGNGEFSTHPPCGHLPFEKGKGRKYRISNKECRIIIGIMKYKIQN